MRASELLRKLADVIDSQESAEQQPTEITNRPDQSDVQADNTDSTEVTTMVPPLQQKHELLKKAAGVDSMYDDGESCEADPLEQMKKMAGIPAVMVAAEDNDIEG